jgi:hypothetical protein
MPGLMDGISCLLCGLRVLCVRPHSKCPKLTLDFGLPSAFRFQIFVTFVCFCEKVRPGSNLSLRSSRLCGSTLRSIVRRPSSAVGGRGRVLSALAFIFAVAEAF